MLDLRTFDLAFFNPSPIKLKRCAVATASTLLSNNPFSKCDEFPAPPASINGILHLLDMQSSKLKS